MPYNRRIIFLSLSIFSSSLSQENFPQNNLIDEPIRIKPLHVREIPKTAYDLIKEQLLQQQTQPTTQQPAFSDADIAEMKLVFATSPKEAQLIVKHLQDPTFFELTQDYRSTTFFGEPGSGKTTMAKAIAYTMSQHGWEYKFLSSTSLLGEYRNQTAMRLKKELDAIETSKKPTILIIDELNRLLENAESKHHDTDTTATTLWTFIDKQKGNKNFFFIGTMNRINKLPKPYKSRILLNSIKFPPITDSKIKSNFIRKNLTTATTILDDEITDAFLANELEKIGSCVGRDLNNISDAIYKINKTIIPTPAPIMVIKKAAIVHAIDQYIKSKIELDYDAEEETDEQRQNRHHKENIELQKIYHSEQKLLQEKNQEMQKRHFVQQQMIEIALKTDSYVDFTGHIGTTKRKEIMDLIISDEQKKFYDKVMKKTLEVEAQVDAENAKKWPWDRI